MFRETDFHFDWESVATNSLSQRETVPEFRTVSQCLSNFSEMSSVQFEMHCALAGEKELIYSLPASETFKFSSVPELNFVSVASELPSPTSENISQVRSWLESGYEDEMMLVISAGQSLSLGTTLQSNFETLWDGPVDSERAFMLDFGHPGFSARGWNHFNPDPDMFRGLVAMESHVTETHAPAMIARILAEFDQSGLQAPNLLHFGTGAHGASILQLMTSSGDLVQDVEHGLARSAVEDVFAVARPDGKFDYFVDDGTQAIFLDTHRHPPGLWDTMEAQLQFAVNAAGAAGHEIHHTAAVAFVQGTADAGLEPGTFGYDWALAKYFDMIEAELRARADQPEINVVFAVSQAQGEADAMVPLDQLQIALSDPRVVLGPSQHQFRFAFGSNPGSDHRHLNPEGYMHLGQSLGASLGDALLGKHNDPILVASVNSPGAGRLIVEFDGVDGWLVEDHSLFSSSQGFVAPENLGLGLVALETGGLIELESARISGRAQVEICTGDVLDGDYRLFIGVHGQELHESLEPSALQSYNSVTLRDSTVDPMVLPQGYNRSEVGIYDFAPIQAYDFTL